MNCPDEKRLIAFIEQDLPAGEAETLRSHLEECSRCTREANQYRTLLNSLNDRDRPDVDDAFVQRVMNEAGFELARERDRQAVEAAGTLSVLRRFVRHNASWIASLSLHFCLIFLITLLAISEFSSEPAASRQETFTGLPVPPVTREASPDGDFRERFLWRGRLRQLRTASKNLEPGPCIDQPDRNQRIEQTYELLVNKQHERGYWSGEEDTGRAQTTALAVLALLRGGHFPASDRSAYGQTVRKGLSYLRSKPASAGRLNDGSERSTTTHGIVTAALLDASVMTGELEYRQAAVDALEVLVRTLEQRKRTKPPGYWTLASLKLGKQLGHRRAERLFDRSVGSGAKHETPADPRILETLSFRPQPSVTGEQLTAIRRLLRTGRKNPAEFLKHEYVPGLIDTAHELRNKQRIEWSTFLREFVRNLRPTDDRTPAELARAVLVLQACRSYPR